MRRFALTVVAAGLLGGAIFPSGAAGAEPEPWQPPVIAPWNPAFSDGPRSAPRKVKSARGVRGVGGVRAAGDGW